MIVNMETIVIKHLFLYSYIHNVKRAKQLMYFDKNSEPISSKNSNIQPTLINFDRIAKTHRSDQWDCEQSINNQWKNFHELPSI